ncbi:hypothetical protein PQR62_12555 [Herbaspirillum lusitanum]|uniref:Uncharacterized protein n=1 Tax=Herbaspirillum lusitanum TaxID=213312 RepID=A0ABW9AA34_9BURK
MQHRSAGLISAAPMDDLNIGADTGEAGSGKSRDQDFIIFSGLIIIDTACIFGTARTVPHCP